MYDVVCDCRLWYLVWSHWLPMLRLLLIGCITLMMSSLVAQQMRLILRMRRLFQLHFTAIIRCHQPSGPMIYRSVLITNTTSALMVDFRVNLDLPILFSFLPVLGLEQNVWRLIAHVFTALFRHPVSIVKALKHSFLCFSVSFLLHAVKCGEVLFLVPSACGFLFVYKISQEPLNGFAPNSHRRCVWSLAETRLKVKVTRDKNGIFWPFRQPACPWCLVKLF